MFWCFCCTVGLETRADLLLSTSRVSEREQSGLRQPHGTVPSIPALRANLILGRHASCLLTGCRLHALLSARGYRHRAVSSPLSMAGVGDLCRWGHVEGSALNPGLSLILALCSLMRQASGNPIQAGAEGDRKSTRLNSSHKDTSRMPSSA